MVCMCCWWQDNQCWNAVTHVVWTILQHILSDNAMRRIWSLPSNHQAVTITWHNSNTAWSWWHWTDTNRSYTLLYFVLLQPLLLLPLPPLLPRLLVPTQYSHHHHHHHHHQQQQPASTSLSHLSNTATVTTAYILTFLHLLVLHTTLSFFSNRPMFHRTLPVSPDLQVPRRRICGQCWCEAH